MEENNEMQRGLKQRHLTMIAIGGSIGTGLFVASGSTISTAGPAGALVAYVLIGVLVYFMMTSLGELATYMPVSGSFSTYATRFVDPAFGFALGWNYWFNWAITLAVDISTSSIIMEYWFPDVPGWIFSAIFFVIIVALNMVSVELFGEAEYWFSMIKVITVICFIGVGLLTVMGILGGHADSLLHPQAIGFKNFSHTPFIGGGAAMLGAFVIAGFSFQGVEMVGITAGESDNPSKAVPRAVKQVFWRIVLFYLVSIFIIGLIIPATSPNLLGSDASDIAMSPFTLVFQRAGLAVAASVMNAVILTSVLSAGNSGLYAGARMLCAMSKEGQAPKFLGKITKKGVPINAMLLTAAVGGFAFITSIFGNKIYTFLLSASGLTGFIAWIGIAVCHLRFRKAYIAQGHALQDLKYQSKFYPFGPVFAILLSVIVIIGQGVPMVEKGQWGELLISYMSIPLFTILYVYYKVRFKTKVIPLDQVDLETDHIE